ncbi:unnamed protein product [Rotaria socialis]|uniref:Uncharacterized protein n=1 Tax=Rotaria socialis TaxID=392032 RepID=A0A817LJP2_9BILA|nr:unnamed protein product [Rotaria socialis]
MGQLEDDKLHGKGKMEFGSGAKYIGDWVNGAMTGEGIYIFPNGNMEFGSGAEYTGDWVDGAMTGEGIYIFPNGNRYERRYSQLRYGCVLNYIGFNKFRGDEIRE